MSTLNFPDSPSVGEIYSFGSRAWQWNGRAWEAYQSVLTDPGGGGASLSRQTITYDTISLEPGELEDFTLQAGNLYYILSVEASTPAWIRVYGTDQARTLDTRVNPGGIPPGSGNDYYAELATVATPQVIRFSPVPIVQATNSLTYLRVQNRDVVARVINLSFVVLTLEQE